jgi:hypothetical protein
MIVDKLVQRLFIQFIRDVDSSKGLAMVLLIGVSIFSAEATTKRLIPIMATRFLDCIDLC